MGSKVEVEVDSYGSDKQASSGCWDAIMFKRERRAAEDEPFAHVMEKSEAAEFSNQILCRYACKYCGHENPILHDTRTKTDAFSCDECGYKVTVSRGRDKMEEGSHARGENREVAKQDMKAAAGPEKAAIVGAPASHASEKKFGSIGRRPTKVANRSVKRGPKLRAAGRQRKTNTKAASSSEKNETFVKQIKMVVKRLTPYEGQFACDHCDFRTNVAVNLRRHSRQHLGKKAFKCPHCEYSCDSAKAMGVHRQIHGEKPYSCENCPMRFSKISNLQRHLLQHTGEKPFACDKCDFRSKEAVGVRLHEKTHTGEKPYSCDQCDYSCVRAFRMKVHKRKHTGEKPYACDQCDYRGTQALKLTIHKRTHSLNKWFACDQCDYTTKQSNLLNAHVKTHSKDAAHVCEECHYRTLNPNSLRIHRRVHTGEKPYKCDICDYRSSDPGGVIKHKRSHTGEKPYMCSDPDCGYTTAHRVCLKTHVKNNHSFHEAGDGSESEECNMEELVSTDQYSLYEIKL